MPRVVALVSRRVGFGLLRGQIVVTRDAGRHWRGAGAAPSNTHEIGFADRSHGWAADGFRLFATSDGGASWRFTFGCGDPGDDGEHLSFSFADSRHGFVLCAGQPGAGSQLKLLYETSDGGRRWRRVPAEQSIGGYSAGIAFSTARVGLLLSHRAGVSRTTDAGRYWRPVRALGFDTSYPGSVAWAGSRRVCLVLSYLLTVFPWELTCSDDAGIHWRRVAPAGEAGPDGAVVFVSAKKGIGAGIRGPVYEPGAILATSDGGRTWTRRGAVGKDVIVDQLLRVSDGSVWAVVRPFGVLTGGLRLFRSPDGGATWSRRPSPAVATAGRLSFPTAKDGLLATDRGLFRTADGGLHWSFDPRAKRSYGATFATVSIGFRPELESFSLVTRDGGKTWKPLAGVGSTPYVLDGLHWWIRDEERSLLRTPDGGRHWERIRFRRPLYGRISFVSPQTGYAGDGGNGFYRTLDGGRTWRFVQPAAANG